MRPRAHRPAFTLFQLLVVLAVLLMLLGLLLPAVQKVREAEARMKSSNNLKQIGLALHNYAGAMGGQLPPGADKNDFSASAYLLPYLEQDPVYRTINFKRPMKDGSNDAARQVRIKTFESPLDEIQQVKKGHGATNYLYNHLVFYKNSAARFATSFPDGTSNTVATGETLKGDNSPKAVTVLRQHVLLGDDALKGLKPDAGVKYFKEDKHVVSDRCSSWMDGRFLQGTFNGQLRLNDERPDVSCGGLGGVSALRSHLPVVMAGMADGSVRSVSVSVSHETWKAAMTPNGGETLGPDW